jgi:preprotein translocase subunit SecB
MSIMEYYQLIRNEVKLIDVELVSLQCAKNQNEQEENEDKILLKLHREVKLISEREAEIFLRAVVGFENDGPFLFDLRYKGLCISVGELQDEDFEKYAYEQVVPLLLPYARECVSSTMARMALPIYTIPTMDVLQTIEVNREEEEKGE